MKFTADNARVLKRQLFLRPQLVRHTEDCLKYKAKLRRDIFTNIRTSWELSGLFYPDLPKIWMSPFGCTMSLGSNQPVTDLSTRNVSWGSKAGRYVGLTTLPPSCAECLEIWKPQTNATIRVSNRPVQGLLYLCLTRYFNPKHEEDKRKSVWWESRCSLRTDKHDKANTQIS
jgi:hypothetical protein